jgi:hypothetical protein
MTALRARARRWHPAGAVLAAVLAGSWPAVVPATGRASSPAAPLRLSYVLYGHGFHVMDVDADVELTPAGYRISLHNRTAGLVGVLVHTDVTSIAVGRFDGARAQPSGFTSSGQSRGAQRVARIAYPDGVPQVLELTPVDHDRDPVAASATIGSIDALSAVAALVHAVDQTGQCDGEARIFDGLRLSTLQARTIGEQALPPSSNSPYAGPALRCDFTGRQIGGFLHNADAARLHRPQQGSAWLARPIPGGPRLPIRVTFENPRFGRATLFLTRVVPQR